jgi:hypothetical protein
MRRLGAALLALAALAVAGSAEAAGTRVLTRGGDLYTAAVIDEQVVVTARTADGTVSELEVPQAMGIEAGSLQIAVDPASGALYVLWQKRHDLAARLRLATFVDGTWFGPATFAGNDGTAALNPQMRVQRAVSSYLEESEEGEKPEVVELATTFIHLAWWSRTSEDDVGIGMYAALPVNPDGLPKFRELAPVALVDFLPYGITCFDIGGAAALTHPKLLSDPETGNPHIFATDFGDCIFQIIELAVETVPDEASPDKRRRQIIILRNPSMIALRPDLPLETTKIEVGRGLKLMLHWDTADGEALDYLELDREGLSPIKRLSLADGLDHEQAVDLIRALIN